MGCECSIAALFPIGFQGIISASLSGSSEFIDIISSCSTGVNIFDETQRRKLKGPSIGTMNISAYAFPKGATDKFLGTTCPSQAGISFNTQQRFDCESKVTRIIRIKSGEAFREGDPINGITLLGDICSFRSLNASAQGGPFNRITDTTRLIGTDLIWSGPPFSFDSRNPDSLDFSILGLDVKLTSFSVSVTAPSVAQNQYTFSYSIASCSGDVF